MKLSICAILALGLIDIITVSDLRSLLFGFLRVNNNHKQVGKLHASQSILDRITLDYIDSMQEKPNRELHVYHTLYKAVLYSIVPQYVLLFVCLAVNKTLLLYFAGALFVIKVVINFIVSANLDTNHRSKFRKSRK